MLAFLFTLTFKILKLLIRSNHIHRRGLYINEIWNQAEIEYEYRINPSGPDLKNTVESNETEVDLVLGQLNMTKSVDKAYATIGDVLNYTVVLNNIENILLTNIVFTDTIPTGTTFVTGSVTINGTSQTTYNPNDTVIITFEVIAN